MRPPVESSGVVEPPFEWRHWRWLALLPDTVVFRADDDDAWRRLELEATVIAQLRAAVGPTIPAIFVRDPRTRTQIRERIHGLTGQVLERMIFGRDDALEPGERYRATCPLTARGSRLAIELGRTLAQIHGAISIAEAETLGLAENAPRLGEATARIIEAHAGSPMLERALRAARSWLARRPADMVVVHGDPHLHNVAVDEGSGALRGIFDFDEIARADRHQDLAYLHSSGLPFARAALRAYAEAGQAPDERTVGYFHVICAFDHFSFVPPDAERFPRIVEWATEAVRSLAPEWGA